MNKIPNANDKIQLMWDIQSELVMPDNPKAVAEWIISEYKAFRKKAGKSIEAAFGEGSANLGQPLNLNVELQILQHWAVKVKGHKRQECPYNKIDDSPCNSELCVTFPTWLLCDKHGTKYREMSLPLEFDSQMCVCVSLTSISIQL